MEVLQTYIVKSEIVLSTLKCTFQPPQCAFAVLFECEKNHWFIRIDDHLEPISPELAIHIKYDSQ